MRGIERGATLRALVFARLSTYIYDREAVIG
jgi:hypothetical protein